MRSIFCLCLGQRLCTLALTLLTPARAARAAHANPPKPQAFDEHVNMVLGDCEETHTSEELDAETGEITIKRAVRSMGMLFVRGDTVVYISPR